MVRDGLCSVEERAYAWVPMISRNVSLSSAASMIIAKSRAVLMCRSSCRPLGLLKCVLEEQPNICATSFIRSVNAPMLPDTYSATALAASLPLGNIMP